MQLFGEEVGRRDVGAVVQIRAPRDRAEAQNLVAHDQAAVEDEVLVARARSGDRRAEDALVKRHAREIARVVTRLLGTSDEVEDMVQDVFVSAFEHVDRLNEPALFRGWLLRIAINKVRMRIRRRRMLRLFGLDRTTPDETLAELASEDASPEVRAELVEIDEVLDRLPANVRIAWMLRNVEGYTVRDVSRLCGCSLATTKRRLASAQESLLRSMTEEVFRRGA